jgi:hypothetical protein
MVVVQYKGNGVDYAHQYCDIPYAFALALPTGGETGFDPAASMIQGIVDETWQGIKALVEHVLAVTANE